MRKLFSLIATILFAGSMMATDVTFVAGTDVAEGTSITKDNVTLSVTSGVFNRTDNYRCYANNTMTISCAVGTITNIAFTFSGSSNTGGWDTSYQPNATSWTSPSTSGQARMTQVVVSYTAAAVAAPTFTPKSGDFVGSVNVTLACATSEAVVYYTTDENFKTSPSTTDWIPYSTEITLSNTTTIWAAALKGDEWSDVAEKTYTKHELINCAAAAALAKDEIAFLDEVTVTYVNGGNIYVKDASGYELLYAFDYGLEPGDVVSGFVGVSSPYSGLPELKPSGITKDDLTVVHGTAPDPEEITAIPTAADINKYLVINNVSITGEFTTSNKTSLTATLGEQTFTLYNNFKIAQTFVAGKKYDIVGCGAIYNTTLQLYFVSATLREYNVYIADGIENGTITRDKEAASEGETVTVTITPDAGYELDHLTATGGDLDFTVNGNTATFIMPGRAVTIGAVFVATAPAEYNIFISGGITYGNIVADKTSAAEGETVTLTITPEDNYELDELTVTGLSASDITINGNTATFIMPGHEVDVNATFVPVPAGCDWSSIAWFNVGIAETDENYDQFKICKEGEYPNVVNIQTAPWADNNKGIYVNFPSAEIGTISLPAGQYKVDGAGILLYLSAFTAKETEVTIQWQSVDRVFTVYNDKGTDTPTAIDNTNVVEKAQKFIENGQLFIIKNGVKYNAQGAVIK